MVDQAEQSRDTAQRVGGSAVILSELTNQAIRDYLTSGAQQSMMLRSTATPGADGLHVNTVNQRTGDVHNMVVSGRSELGAGILSEGLTGDYNIAHANGGQRRTEQAHIEITGRRLDRDDQMRASISFSTPNGELLRAYNPATMVPVPGRTYSTGDQMYFGRLTPGSRDNNCQAQNPSNPGNRRYECNFMLNNEQGVYSINETRHHYGDNASRMVLRRGTDVIGIIEQSYRWNGNQLGEVTTRIRPSTAR